MDDDLQNENTCWECEGEGVVVCTSCGGRRPRFTMRYTPTDFSYQNFGFRHERAEACHICSGTGKEPCPTCANNGEII